MPHAGKDRGIFFVVFLVPSVVDLCCLGRHRRVNDDRKCLPFEFIWPDDLRNPPTAYRVFFKAFLECGLHDQGKKPSEEFDTLHASWTARTWRATEEMGESE